MGTKRRRDQNDTSGSPEADLPRKKHHGVPEVDTKLAGLFNDLADELRDKRLSAAREIIQLVSTTTKDKNEKILQRLIRGLCSSRKAARLGFVITLTEVFAKRCDAERNDEISGLDIREVPELIDFLTTVPEGSTNQEWKDYQLGRCLAFRAFIESRVLYKHDTKDSLPVFEDVLERLFALYKDVPYLRQECGSAANHVLSMHRNCRSEFATALIRAYQKATALKSPEGLAAWLDVQQDLPEVELPSGTWHKNDPLGPKDRQALIQILRDNSFEQTGDYGTTPKVSTGNAPKVPCVAWNQVLRTAFQRSLNSEVEFDFGQFWKEVVDDGYFSAKSSIERKAVGLQVFQMTVSRIPPTLMHHIFSPNLLRCIINQRSSPKNNLYLAAQTSITAMKQRPKASRKPSATEAKAYDFKPEWKDNEHDDYLKALIETLLGDLGLVNFDKLTRTKFLEELFQKLQSQFCESLIIPCLDRLIAKPVVSEYLDAESSRRASADLLLLIARQQGYTGSKIHERQVEKAHGAIIPVLTFPWLQLLEVLVRHGYLIETSPSDPPISKTIRELFQSRTMSVLTHTLNARIDDDFEYPQHVIMVIERLSKSPKYQLALEADETVRQVLSKSIKRLASINDQIPKHETKSHTTILAFRLLVSLATLQVHNGDADAVAILEELHDCYDMWTKSNNTTTALIEILLGFLSRPSALFRKLAEQVFTAISTQVGADGLDALLDILSKPENVAGQRELFENADDVAEEVADMITNPEEESEDEEEDSDDEQASDVEVIEANGHATDDSGSLSASADSEDSHESDDDGNDDAASARSGDTSALDSDDEVTAFEAKLAQTLGTGKPSAANGTASASSSDESDMDDDQMMALDGHLTTIFKERSKQAIKKLDVKGAKGTVVNFKNRVLDLLAIFVKQCSARSVILAIIPALLRLIRTTTTKAVAEKAFGVLKSLFDTCNKNKVWPDEGKAKDLFELLEEIHGEVRRAASRVHGNAASRAGLFVVKMLVNKDKRHYGKVVDMYAALQKEWYGNAKSKIPASVFTEWTSWGINSRK